MTYSRTKPPREPPFTVVISSKKEGTTFLVALSSKNEGTTFLVALSAETAGTTFQIGFFHQALILM